MTDIKTLVAEMEQALALSYPRIPALGQFAPIAFWQDIFPELKRLWAVEQERNELREAILELGYLTGTEGHCGDHVVLTVRLTPREADTWNALVAKLHAEKGGEVKP